MPRLEAYYHDGMPENTRKEVKDATNLVEKLKNRITNSAQLLELRQKLWLNPDNPALWDGDEDD